MRCKSKNTKTTVLIILIAVAAVLLARSLGFFSTRSATRLLYSGSEGRDHWSGQYSMLHGTMDKTLRLSSPGTLHIDITTESGSLSLTIWDAEKNTIFSQENIPTGSFDLEVPGKVKVRIAADQHKGGFSLSPASSLSRIPLGGIRAFCQCKI